MSVDDDLAPAEVSFLSLTRLPAPIADEMMASRDELEPILRDYVDALIRLCENRVEKALGLSVIAHEILFAIYTSEANPVTP